MKASDWTVAVQNGLKKQGKDRNFDADLSGTKMEITGGKKPLDVRPDIVWSRNGKIGIVFEIDQFKQGYKKTIYGSMLQGLVLAKQKGARFIEIVPRDENGKKACIISAVLKNEFKEALPEFCVIQVRKSKAENSAKDQAIYDLKKQLDKLLRPKAGDHSH